MQLSLQDMYMFSIAPVDYDNGLCMKALHLVMSVCCVPMLGAVAVVVVV